MIVSCPSCGTRYHHHSIGVPAVAKARCSRCDEMVPLVAARRPYVLAPPRMLGKQQRGQERSLLIGMDDPLLADKLKGTEPEAETGRAAGALGFRIAVDKPKSGSVGGRAARGTGHAIGGWAAGSRRWSAKWSQEQAGRRRRAKQIRAELSSEAAPQSREKSKERLVGVLLTTVGAATAYYFSAEQGLEPFTWTVVGGGWGFFMAWICMRWMRSH